jgi:hypothetical protein
MSTAKSMKGSKSAKPAKSSKPPRAIAGPSTAPAADAAPELLVDRVQTGLRIEKRLLKVLKAMAEYHDMGLGDLVEGIVLHAFEGRSAFGAESLARIAALKQVYGLDLDASAAHRLVERS